MWERVEKMFNKISWPQIGKEFMAYLVPGVMFMILGNYYGEHRVLKMDGLLFAEDGLGKWWKYFILLVFAYVLGRVIYTLSELLLNIIEAVKEKKGRQISWLQILQRLFWNFKVGKKPFGSENTPVVENLLLTEVFASHPGQEKVYAKFSIRYSFAVGILGVSLLSIYLMNWRFAILAAVFLLICFKEKTTLEEVKSDLSKLVDNKLKEETEKVEEKKNLELDV